MSTTILKSGALEDAVYQFPSLVPHILCPWGKPLAEFGFSHSLFILCDFTTYRSAQPMLGLLITSDTLKILTIYYL